MEDMRIPVHVEVEMKPDSLMTSEAVEEQLTVTFKKSYPFFRQGVVDLDNSHPLQSDITRVLICETGSEEVPFWKADLLFYVYRNLEGEPEKDFLEGEEELPACDQWELPNQSLCRLWESIIVEDRIKSDILGYATSAMIFTTAMVDPDIISWNRMIMLHGPPGSGKTTLCKAIAQKVYIRNMSDYDSGFLLEINSHSLFSKWFSESGKLVMKLFDHINEIADDPQSFVCILIDEVESITSNRTSSVSSNEPGDAVRVVNAVLTSLDALKRRSNVLVLCTSNMQSAIDPAFRDRVDMSFFLGPPSLQARYQILKSCLEELSLKNIITPPFWFEDHFHGDISSDMSNQSSTQKISQLEIWARRENKADDQESETQMMVEQSDSGSSSADQLKAATPHEKLVDIARGCDGYSGRSLRKLPLKAHAMHLQRRNVTVDQYLSAISMTIDKQQADLNASTKV